MAIFDYPEALMPQNMEWGSIKAGVQHRSPFNGSLEAVEFPGERWRISLTLRPAPARLDRAPLAEAFFGRLAGGVHRVRLRHFLSPAPRGTLRGAPVVASSALQGAEAIAITTTGTLKAGDFFKVGGQLCRVFADCTPVSGTLTVPLVQRLRGPVPAGTAVQWDKPTALFILPAMNFTAGYSPGVQAPVQVDLEEVFS
jgi:hypothetical protein